VTIGAVMPAARIWRITLGPPGRYEHTTITSGLSLRMSVICADTEASPFWNVSERRMLVPFIALHACLKPVHESTE